MFVDIYGDQGTPTDVPPRSRSILGIPGHLDRPVEFGGLPAGELRRPQLDDLARASSSRRPDATSSSSGRRSGCASGPSASIRAPPTRSGSPSTAIRYARGHHLRRARRARRRVPLGRRRAPLRPEPDRRPRLHRARGAHLRQLAAVRRVRGVPALRLLERARATACPRTSSRAAPTPLLFNALPYVLTLIAVAGVIGRSTPPAADRPSVRQAVAWHASGHGAAWGVARSPASRRSRRSRSRST